MSALIGAVARTRRSEPALWKGRRPRRREPDTLRFGSSRASLTRFGAGKLSCRTPVVSQTRSLSCTALERRRNQKPRWRRLRRCQTWGLRGSLWASCRSTRNIPTRWLRPLNRSLWKNPSEKAAALSRRPRSLSRTSQAIAYSHPIWLELVFEAAPLGRTPCLFRTSARLAA